MEALDFLPRQHMLESVAALAEAAATRAQVRGVYERILGTPVATILAAGSEKGALSTSEGVLAAAETGELETLTHALTTLGAVGSRATVAPLTANHYRVTETGDCARGSGTGEFTAQDLVERLAFADVWGAVLGVLPRLLASVLGVWRAEFRVHAAALVTPDVIADLYFVTAHEAHLLSVKYKIDSEVVRAVNEVGGASEGPGTSVACLSVHPTAKRVVSVRTALLSVLGLATQHKSIYLHAAHDQAVATIISALPDLDHGALAMVFKTFVEPYIAHAVPTAAARPTTARLAAFVLQTSIMRLRAAWGETPVPTTSSGSTAEERYHACGLINSPHVGRLCETKEELMALRLAALWDLTRAVGDLAAGFLGKRGPLVVDKVKDADEQVAPGADDELVARRACVRSLVLYTSAVRREMVQLVVALLETADSSVCQRAISMAETIFADVADTPAYVDAARTLASDGFGACLRVVLSDAAWCKGLEWDFLRFMEMVYSRSVLGIDVCEERAPAATTSAPSKTNMTAWTGPSHATHRAAQPLGSWPRDMLLTSGNVTHEQVASMERMLLTVNRKKRRGLLRDAVVGSAASAGGGQGRGKATSSERSTGGGASRVQNIGPPPGGGTGYATLRQQGRMKESAAAAAAGSEQGDNGLVGLSGLFG